MIGFAMLSTALTGALLLVLVFVGNDLRDTESHTVLTWHTLEELLGLLLLPVLPFALPPTVVGGWLAARTLAGDRPRSRRAWIRFGVLRGAALGSAWCALCFAAIVWSDGAWSAWIALSAIGAAAGAFVGALVASYCACCEAPRLAAQRAPFTRSPIEVGI